MTQKIFPLHPKPARPVIEKPRRMPLTPGRAYGFLSPGADGQAFPGGAVGGYSFNSRQARLLPVSRQDGEARAYIVDADAISGLSAWQLRGHEPGQRFSLAINHLTLASSEMDGPELVSKGALTHLVLHPRFQLLYDSESYAAELGVIHLVQSQRFMQLDNGERIELLAAEEPVLYLQDRSPLTGLGPVQAQGGRQEYGYGIELRQAIPAQCHGVEVESVTVLEQYRTYFMQRECGDLYDTIWTPALAPVTWGWSIRVGRRSDREWGILRRKLIRPTVGHDGLEFPLWEDNHLSFNRTSPAGC